MRALCILAIVGFAVAFSGHAQAEEGAKTCPACRYVMVVPSGQKPSIARSNAKFEVQCTACKKNENGTIECSKCGEKGKCDSCAKKEESEELLCNACIKKMYPKGAPSGKVLYRILEGKAKVYECTKCKTLCWRDNGKECVHADKAECETCDEIKAELNALNDRKACPHCVSHNSKSAPAGKKAPMDRKSKEACPECTSSIKKKGKCEVCATENVNCNLCKAATKETQK